MSANDALVLTAQTLARWGLPSVLIGRNEPHTEALRDDRLTSA